MKTQLEKLVEDESFGVGALDSETGIMINKHKDAIDFIFLFFEDRVEVYLNLYDENEDSSAIIGRDYLAVGIGETLEEAKSNAVLELDRQAYSNIQ
ncbi:hypothetical protein [Bacillus cihuensis]|uniref:hypothetical protein n=1 Tax=Bacillus cihuensis TaxID=1208599 RepID=UPI0004183EF4|nr:hypothetical protein [Bacillus cihuensis]